MKTIYKYQLATNEGQVVQLPVGASILSLQVQNNVPHIWVIFDKANEKNLEERSFITYGTGHIISDLLKVYVGTYQLPLSGLVLHVFELINS
jgi:hypothetical protein